ncbi:DUF3883 domain-containing protein [Lutispora sp.]|uniref:DUF3883 domain-containing protein n=1 Tax=Lutispora sp. TaxID=2828727 RepID=UPI003562C020
MARYRKGIDDCLLRLAKLPDETQTIINQFLSDKKDGGSRSTYFTPILTIFELTENEHISELTVDDYETMLSYYGEGTTGYRCVKSFFKYLDEEYLLNDEKHLFSKKFREERRLTRQKTQNSRSKSASINSEYIPALNFEQVQQLNEFINFDFDDISKLQCSFICYMLFCTDCPEKVLEKEVKVSDYMNGRIRLASGYEYEVPERYEPMFNKMRSREIHNGFGSLYKYLRPIEAVLKVDKVVPQVIINARKQNKMKCGLCGKEYFNTADNWKNIESRIVCTNCAEALKKKFNYNLTDLEEIKINRTKIGDEIEKSAILYDYDKLKHKLMGKQVDFKRLNEFFDFIGKLGEAYVYKREKERLKGKKLADLVSDKPSAFPQYGYDILSYTDDGEEIYIEVKTEPRDKENDFFLTDTERRIGEKYTREGKKYWVYRVHNILAEDEAEVRVDIIKDIFNNPMYEFSPYSWRIHKS